MNSELENYYSFSINHNVTGHIIKLSKSALFLRLIFFTIKRLEVSESATIETDHLRRRKKMVKKVILMTVYYSVLWKILLIREDWWIEKPNTETCKILIRPTARTRKKKSIRADLQFTNAVRYSYHDHRRRDGRAKKYTKVKIKTSVIKDSERAIHRWFCTKPGAYLQMIFSSYSCYIRIYNDRVISTLHLFVVAADKKGNKRWNFAKKKKKTPAQNQPYSEICSGCCTSRVLQTQA